METHKQAAGRRCCRYTDLLYTLVQAAHKQPAVVVQRVCRKSASTNDLSTLNIKIDEQLLPLAGTNTSNARALPPSPLASRKTYRPSGSLPGQNQHVLLVVSTQVGHG